MKRKRIAIVIAAAMIIVSALSYIQIQPTVRVHQLNDVSNEIGKEEALRFQSPDITLLKNLIEKLIEVASY